MKPMLAIASAMLLLDATSAFAQDPRPGQDPASPLRRADDLTPPAPAGRSESPLHGIAFDLAANEEKSQTSIQIGDYHSQLLIDGSDVRQTSSNWSLKLTIPIGGHDDLTSGSVLDALSNGPKLSLNIGIFGFRGAGDRFSDPQGYFSRVIMSDARTRCHAHVDGQTGLTEAARRTASANCEAYPDPDFAAQYSSFSDAAINRSLYHGMWSVGLEGNVSENRFEFIDTASLAKRNPRRYQFSAALHGEWYPADAMSAILARAEYQNAYKAGDAIEICRPVVVDPNTDCAHGVPSPPRHIERLNFSLEYRQVFDAGWSLGSIAISPRGSVDALSGDYALEFPVYFIPRGDLPVAPGVSLSYASDKDDLQFAVFLRWSFSLGS